MKTEREIRQFRDDHRKAMDVPCSCAATGHAYECEAGRMMGVGALAALSWLLDEEPAFQAVVDNTHRLVAGHEAAKERRS